MDRSLPQTLLWLTELGAPVQRVLLPMRSIANAGDRLNLPNNEYWLNPRRREATVEYLLAHGAWLAVAVALLPWYVQ